MPGGMAYPCTGGKESGWTKIAITIDDKILKQVDDLVESRQLPNLCKTIQDDVAEDDGHTCSRF
jgi:hypothetical protein